MQTDIHTYICKYKTATDRHSHTYMNRGDLPKDRWMEHQLLRVSFLSRNGNEMMRGGFFYLYWLLFASKTVKILHKKLALLLLLLCFSQFPKSFYCVTLVVGFCWCRRWKIFVKYLLILSKFIIQNFISRLFFVLILFVLFLVLLFVFFLVSRDRGAHSLFSE